MINEAKQGLEDILRHNDAMSRNQEREEYLQRQEENWREDKRISKEQEESEEQNKRAEMNACMNNEQQFPEYHNLQSHNGTHEVTKTCPYGPIIYRNFF